MDLLRDLALSVVAFVAVGLVFRAGRSARISETLAVAAGTTVIAAVGAIAMFRGRGHAVAVNPQASTLPYSLLGSAAAGLAVLGLLATAVVVRAERRRR